MSRFWAHHLAACIQSQPDEGPLYRQLSIDALARRIKNSYPYRDTESYEDAGHLEAEAQEIVCNIVAHQLCQDLLHVLLPKPQPTKAKPYNQFEADQIRLLLLRPSMALKQPIECEFIIDSLENKPK